MNNDLPFRLCALAILVATLPVVAYHRFKAHTGEKLDRRQEGFVLFPLRLAGLAAWAGIFTWLISPATMEWSRVELPAAARWAGLPLGAFASAWLVWMVRSLGRNLTDTVVTRREHTLVTHGPYRFVRHPLYAGLLPFTLSLTLLAANWFVCGMSLAVYVLLVIRTKKEEENLVARFGDAYRDYMARTGRFLPWL